MTDFRALLNALDPSRIEDECRRWNRARVRSIRPIHAVPSPDGSAALLYEIEAGDKAHAVAGRWFDASRELPDPKPGQVVLRRSRVVLVPPEADPKLPGLAEALEPGKLRPIRGAPRFRPIRSVLLAHRPGKRAAIRVDGVDDRSRPRALFVKALRADRVERFVERVRALRAEGLSPPRNAIVPRLLSADAPRGLVFFEWFGGRPVHESLGEPAIEETLEWVGRALCRLHSTSIPGLDPHDRASEVALIKHWAEVLACIVPEREREVLKLSAMLLRRARRPVREQPTTSHRDFHDKQVLCNGSRLAIVDLDSVAIAERALDLGNFTAHLRLRAEQALLPEQRVDACIAAFHRGYGRAGTVALSSERWYEAATLFRLAGLYALRPGHAHLVSRLLSASERALATQTA